MLLFFSPKKKKKFSINFCFNESQIEKMTTHITKASTVASKMVNGNNSNAPSHNNVTNGASVNALNAANLSGTSAAPTNNTDFGDNINSKSEFYIFFFIYFVCFFFLVSLPICFLFFVFLFFFVNFCVCTSFIFIYFTFFSSV